MNTARINPTSSIGFLIGISAWSISFITLIWAYIFYRLKTGAWLVEFVSGSIMLQAMVNTLILIISSYVFHKFLQSKEMIWFTTGLISGLLFVMGQVKLWFSLINQGLTLQNSLAGSFFYLLTGFHALHILIGLLILFMVSLNQVSRGECEVFEVRFNFALKFWDLLLIFWAVLLILIFFIK